MNYSTAKQRIAIESRIGIILDIDLEISHTQGKRPSTDGDASQKWANSMGESSQFLLTCEIK